MEAVRVVVVVLVLVFVALAVYLERVRVRVRRLERNATTPAAELARLATMEQAQGRLAAEVQLQARLAAAAQAQSVTEIRALRDELTTARVGQSAAAIGARRAEKRAEAAAEEDPEETRDTVATPAPASIAPKPSDNEGEATSIFHLEPPLYAKRLEPMRPPALLAPLADPDLIGSEDIADEVARGQLGPDEQTPPRQGRAPMLIRVFEAPEGGA